MSRRFINKDDAKVLADAAVELSDKALGWKTRALAAEEALSKFAGEIYSAENNRDIVDRLNRHSADCSGHEPSLSLLQRTADEAANEIAASRRLVAELLKALQLARTFMVDFDGLPTWEAQNPLRTVDAAIAKAVQS